MKNEGGPRPTADDEMPAEASDGEAEADDDGAEGAAS